MNIKNKLFLGLALVFVASLLPAMERINIIKEVNPTTGTIRYTDLTTNKWVEHNSLLDRFNGRLPGKVRIPGAFELDSQEELSRFYQLLRLRYEEQAESGYNLSQ